MSIGRGQEQKHRAHLVEAALAPPRWRGALAGVPRARQRPARAALDRPRTLKERDLLKGRVEAGRIHDAGIVLITSANASEQGQRERAADRVQVGQDPEQVTGGKVHSARELDVSAGCERKAGERDRRDGERALDLGAHEQGEQRALAAHEPVDLAAVARDVAARHQEQLAKVGITLSLDAGHPIVGRWDRMRLEQVATNLLSNAIKFGEGKPIDVIVDDDDEEARLIVRDHCRAIG